MLVSWTWLSRYLDLNMTPEEVANALSLSGLNHEETKIVNGEVVIDLEVTSNRSDCLSHIGVAREIAVLFDKPLRCDDPQPAVSRESISSVAQVSIDNAAACSRYTARLLRDCRVKPSPAWLADSLSSIGIGVVNNIVDITNYVMFECGQPLHAFDFDRIAGQQIVVRAGRQGEKLQAIDHKEYTLDPSMCVIADADHAVAIAGVMGGARSEVSTDTKNILLESAIFSPMWVRRTARALKLHSPSSFRFERKINPAGVDWASRRACELILELAGGELLSGSLDVGDTVKPRDAVPLRLSQIERILGICVDRGEVIRILAALGCYVDAKESATLSIVPPQWRHDLSREVDMIEEVARIHGYDNIPEDCPIAVVPSAKRDVDHAMEKVRTVLGAAGIHEAMTPSVVTEGLDNAVRSWTELAALETLTPLLKGANRLRRSLLPSLLQSRADNWTAAGVEANLFEIAHIYLPASSAHELPEEAISLGIVSGMDFYAAKGIVAAILSRLGCRETLSVAAVASLPGFAQQESVCLRFGELTIGYLGAVDKSVNQRWKLPGKTIMIELNLGKLLQFASLVPQHQKVSHFPSVERDLNLIVAENVLWSDLESSVRDSLTAGLANVRYRETYRAPEKDGPHTKRVLLSVELRREDGTLTGEEADGMIQAILAKCAAERGAKLLA